MSIVAIITARGGSKRIPKKNIKEFCGKPIIWYSINAALYSDIFSEVMVSTDDSDIADISRHFGAKVPFMRSAETSGDFATTSDVLIEVINEYEKRGIFFENLCYIYPTAPFVTAEKLRKAYKMFCESKCDSLLPVVKFSFPPQRGFVIENDLLQMPFPEYLNARSQDLQPIYHDCGQFSFVKTEAFKKSKKIIMDKTVPMILPDSEVQDIDTEEDWLLAEIKYKILMQNKMQ